jgi:hypothetical protein
VTTAIVPVGHYLGLVHDDSVGQPRHRVRVGRGSEPLDSAEEAAVWFAAHSFTNLAQPVLWTRDRILDVLPEPRDLAASAVPILLRDGLLAEVDDAFADRHRVVPLTFGMGWRYGDDGLALGVGERAVSVDGTVLAVWERGTEFPTLREACADAAPEAPDAALSAMTSALHRLLAVSAVYVDVAATST